MTGWTRVDRQILAVAVPAFFALVAEPLMLMVDTAIVGHLGTSELAGLAAASAVLATVVGLCVFLAYGSTAAVSRSHGAGDDRAALGLAVSGLWLALVLGLVLGAATAVAAPVLNPVLASSDAAIGHANTYLVIAAGAVPAMLLVLAATGALRGVLDLRTPLVVVILANIFNAALSLVLVYGAGWGVAGAAVGTTVAQWGAALWLTSVVLRHARRAGASVRPRPAEILDSAVHGVPLLVRTLTLRASLLLATAVAATLGDASLAAYQVAATIVTFLAFALDAIAIAGQTLTGRALGAGDGVLTRTLTRRMIGWGVATGCLAAVVIATTSPLLGRLFTSDDAVLDVLVPALLVVAAIQPVSGVVFVLDGVLIGAGDGRYLAVAGLVVLAAYAPLVLVVGATGAGFTWLWVAWAGFMLARLATLWHRQRSDAWLILGASPR